MRLQSEGIAPGGALSTDLRELASGVDALYMSGRGDVSPRLIVDLVAARATAEERGESVELDLGDCRVSVRPKAFGRHRFWLQHPHAEIGVSDKQDLPPLRIQPKAAYLHAVGPSAALDYFAQLLGGFTRDLRLTASRLDVFADFQGWAIAPDDRLNFVTRATQRDTHEESGVLTGFVFGRRKGKTLLARLYDKSLESRKKGTDWWPSVWGAGYDPAEPVLRIEFEFGRNGLRQYGVDTAAEALRCAPELWAAATGRWLTHRTPSQDATRSRWPFSPEWQQVHRCSFAIDAIGLERIKEGERQGSLRTLMPGTVGYLASVSAVLGVTTLDEALELLPQLVHDYGIASRRTFAERVDDKRRQRGAA